MTDNKDWLSWATELQALAQAGLAYCKDVYDEERYARIRQISAEIMSHMTDIPTEKVTSLFCDESGYQTPKLDCRAAIFENNKILLVKEKDGRWSLPGGWCDIGLSISENTVKEVKEEAGLDAVAERIIAVQDRARHNLPVYAHSICKVFVLCRSVGGGFKPNSETTDSAYFSLEALPPLSEEKNNKEQIKMCFEAYRDNAWQTQFD